MRHKPVQGLLDLETRSAAEIGRDMHKEVEIVLSSPQFLSPFQDSNKTTVTGRVNNLEPEMQDIEYAAKRMEAHGMDPSVLLEADYSAIEARMMEHLAPLRSMAAAGALGLDTPANTFRPRPKRLPGRVVKVAPGLWMRSEKPKKFKGSAAAKKAARRGRKR